MAFSWINPPVQNIELGAFPTDKTISVMCQNIKIGGATPYVRRWAEEAVCSLPNRDRLGEAKAIHEFIQATTRYANDPKGLEYIQTPQYVLERIERGEMPSLDCDCMTVLELSLLRSLGYRTAVKVVAFEPKAPFSHVYGLVEIDGPWIPCDAVRKDKPFGWETQLAKRNKITEVR